MNRELQRFLAFLGATLSLVLVLGVVGQRLLGTAAGADGAIITHLKRLERTGAEVELPAGLLLAPSLQFQRISVVLDADGQGATVTSTLDLTGELRRPRGPVTRVSSLGLERARYRLRDGDWAPDGPVFPRLLQILKALERRREALERGEALPDGGFPWPELAARSYSGLAWYVRSEREDVTVSEDFQLRGNTPARPVDEKGTRRLLLREERTGLFSFPDGIM